MKVNIATAIRNLAALKSDFDDWSSRLASSNVYREKTHQPAYSYDECSKNVSLIQNKIVDIKSKIAISNAKTTVTINQPIPAFGLDEGPKKLAVIQLINFCSEIKTKISNLQSLPTLNSNESTEQEVSYVGSERVLVNYKMVCRLTSRERDELVKSLKNDFSIINLAIENSNHQTTIEISD
jgi:hypothetical protein